MDWAKCNLYGTVNYWEKSGMVRYERRDTLWSHLPQGCHTRFENKYVVYSSSIYRLDVCVYTYIGQCMYGI